MLSFMAIIIIIISSRIIRIHCIAIGIVIVAISVFSVLLYYVIMFDLFISTADQVSLDSPKLIVTPPPQRFYFY